MLRLFTILSITVSMFFAPKVMAQEAGTAMARAMELMREGNWAAARIAARSGGPEAVDVIMWHYLRAGQGSTDEVMDFLARRPDWPGLPYLREKSEAAMSSASAEDILDFFKDHTPQSGTGALCVVRAHLAAGDEGKAQAEVVLAWRSLALNEDEWRVFLSDWGTVLREHHEARLDMALWQGWKKNSEAMLSLVGKDWQAMARARLGLREGQPGVDGLIARIPEHLRDHPGLAYERFMWRLRKGRRSDAIALLLEQDEDKLGAPWAWAGPRLDLARDQLRAGKSGQAYEIASRHGLHDGSTYAQLEWMAGYIALRHLKKPSKAVEHFTRFGAAVDTPISLGRAGYWLGRAYEAAGNSTAAQTAYAKGARYQTSFYGLLAAERLGQAPDPALSGREDFGDWRQAEYTRSSVFAAAILLLAAGEDVLGERFLTHLAESLNRLEIGKMGQMLMEMQRPHIQVMLGKRAAQYGMELPGPYYALPKLVTGGDYPVPKELVLAIARRESEFDPAVISHAGARGYMQLMPRTARAVAGTLGLPYDEERLLSDPAYNARIGSAYLEKMAETFDGNIVLMAAGYNAGPSRPSRWIKEMGDPRASGVDVIDWIEMIPFDETRNYVMRVSESLPVYRARLGKEPHPVPFSRELTGRTMKGTGR